jgi:hypothetical protein
LLSRSTGLPFDEDLLDLRLGFHRISIGNEEIGPLAFFNAANWSPTPQISAAFLVSACIAASLGRPKATACAAW